MSYLLLKYLHIMGACVLFGTGLGIAFFMFSAVRTKDVQAIAATSQIVVKADYLFTLTAALIQPLTGALLVWQAGYEFLDLWIAVSLALYIIIGLCWIPVVFMQLEMAKLAQSSANNESTLPTRFFQLYRRWFILGWPAFISMLTIFALMIFKPVSF